MRPAQLADVETAVRMLLRYPQQEHQRQIVQLLAAADAGDRHRRNHGSPHADFGAGTLMAAANRHLLAPRPAHFDKTVCDIFICVFSALREREHNQNM